MIKLLEAQGGGACSESLDALSKLQKSLKFVRLSRQQSRPGNQGSSPEERRREGLSQVCNLVGMPVGRRLPLIRRGTSATSCSLSNKIRGSESRICRSCNRRYSTEDHFVVRSASALPSQYCVEASPTCTGPTPRRTVNLSPGSVRLDGEMQTRMQPPFRNG